MAIISQPAALSFAGNLGNIVIASLPDIAFTLSVDGSTVLNELYTPVDGKVTVSLKSVVNRYLKIAVPDYNVPVAEQPEAVKTFTATIGGETISFAVVKGGVDGVLDCPAFLSGNFLTWQPQQKNIVLRQPEWLNYYAANARTLVIKAYFADKTTATHNINLPAGKVTSVNTCYDTVNNYFSSPVSYYDIWVEASGNRLTYVQRYIPVPEADNTEIYVFENTLGGLDSFTSAGELTEKIGTEGTLTTQFEETSDSSVDLSVSYEQKTGILKRDESRWLRDLFTSEQRYHVTGEGLRKIYMEEQDNKFKVADLNTFTFEFFYCNQTFYNKVVRNRESLPELLEFPEPDGLFFLTPRLSEYPATAYADDLIIPVQHPYTGKWMQLAASLFAPNANVDINLATYTKAGIASFSPYHFVIENGHVSIKNPGGDIPACDFNKYFYEQDGKLFCRFDLIGEKEVAAYGVGVDGGGSSGGGWDLIDNLVSTRTDAGLTANMGRYLKSLIDSKASDWNEIVGKPTEFTPTAHSHSEYASKDHTHDSYFATSAWDKYFYEKDGKLFCRFDLIGEKEVAAYGVGVDGGGSSGGGWDLIDNLVSTRTDAGLTANMGRYLKSLIDSKASDWNEIVGKPTTFTPAEHTHSYLPLTGGKITNQLIIETVNNNNFNEGIRINRSSNNWSGVMIGTAPGSVASHDGQGWFVAVTPDRNFMINPINSGYNQGLDLYRWGDVYWKGRRLAYADELATSVLYKEVGINATGLDQNKWYPVSIYIGCHDQVKIRVIVSLQENKPSWATHASGFSCRFVEVVNGNGWGTNLINRRILANDYSYAPANPIGGVTQNTMGSTEIIYVRGGGYYYFYVSTGAIPVLNPSGYNWVSGSCSYSTPVINSVLNDNWNWQGSSDIINRANRLTISRSIWGQNFDGSGNVDGDFHINGWIRSYGDRGWYNHTYSGGIYMDNSEAVKIYGNKLLYNDGYRGWGINGHNVGLKLYQASHIGINLATDHYTWGIYCNGDGNMYLGRRNGNVNDTSGGYYYVFGAGVLTVYGNIVTTGETTAYTASDMRLKENIRYLDGLSYLRRLNFYEFDWNDKARELTGDNRLHGFGGLAQDFKNVLPDLVGNIYNSKYLGIRYTKLIPHLGAALLQIDRQQSEHEKRIARIEQQLKIK